MELTYSLTHLPTHSLTNLLTYSLTLETHGQVVSTVVTPLESSISISSSDAPNEGEG